MRGAWTSTDRRSLASVRDEQRLAVRAARAASDGTGAPGRQLRLRRRLGFPVRRACASDRACGSLTERLGREELEDAPLTASPRRILLNYICAKGKPLAAYRVTPTISGRRLNLAHGGGGPDSTNAGPDLGACRFRVWRSLSSAGHWSAGGMRSSRNGTDRAVARVHAISRRLRPPAVDRGALGGANGTCPRREGGSVALTTDRIQLGD